MQEDMEMDGFILRRADPDDCDQIINLVEIGKDDVFNRVYSYPRILKLIESAFLAITVLDREGNVVAFAAFEDFPQVSLFQTLSQFLRLGNERHVR
jgi:N-acetylglutamate synthase-like GNAT family acetyltransferase